MPITLIEPTPISPGTPLPSVGSPSFSTDAFNWVNNLTNVWVGQFNALAQATYQNASAVSTDAAESAAHAADSAANAADAANSAAQSAALAASGANALPWTSATVWQPATLTTAPSACYDPDNNPGLVYRYIGTVAQTTGRPKDNPALWAMIGSLPAPVGQDGKYLGVAGGTYALLPLASWTDTTSTSAQDGTDLADKTIVTVASGTNRYLPSAPPVGFEVQLQDPAALFAGGTWTLKRRDGAHTINNKTEDVVFNYPQAIVRVRHAGAGKWVLA